MNIRQVALGAAFGAAVAVNAALQSLQDAGCFLIHCPGSTRSTVDLLGVTSDSRKRALGFVDAEEDEEDFLDFRDVDDEDEIDVSTSEDDGGSPKTSAQPEESQFLKASNEQNLSTGDCDIQLKQSSVQGNSSKRRKMQGPPGLPFLPIIPPIAQTEEAMSSMLHQTTETVLNTLADAKERRERLLNEMSMVHVPEKEGALKLVNSFIDALVNVSDSLKIVQSALFIKKEGMP